MSSSFPAVPSKPRLAQWCARLLRWPETLLDRAFGSRDNPSYQSGVLAVFFLALVMVTGIPLLFFYRVGAPYQSVVDLQQQVWLGRWLRAVHRYASDAAMVAVAVHLLRMLVSGRFWGARQRAWVSGFGLTAILWVIGVSGLVLVWDQQSWRILWSTLHLMDSWPIFPDPPSRLLGNPDQLGQAFFFLVMFFHVALPLLIAFGLWFHTSKLARPRFWPESSQTSLWGFTLLGLSIIYPAPLDEPAQIWQLPASSHLDLCFSPWLPLYERWGATGLWPTGLVCLLLLLVPRWAAPAQVGEPESLWTPSKVDETLCTGCTDCVQDCPYDAITMVPRTHRDDGRHSPLVARVSPDRCVSCGICAASCAPMGVGPAGRTGRDQLHQLEIFHKQQPLAPQSLVVMLCRFGPGSKPPLAEEGIHWVETGCSGSIHSSLVESWLRKGAAGVMVVSCPPRDCSHREGPKWLEQRFYHGREAELLPRVDRRRIRLFAAASVDFSSVYQEARRFHQELQRLESAESQENPSSSECKRSNP